MTCIYELHIGMYRFHIWKITQYKLSLQNLTRLADWKSGVWDQAEKLDQVRSAMETRLLSWVPEFTYPNDWLAFLVCSYPIDHYSGRKLSLDGVVPAIHPTVTVQPASTSGKPTRRDERDHNDGNQTATVTTIITLPTQILTYQLYHDFHCYRSSPSSLFITMVAAG